GWGVWTRDLGLRGGHPAGTDLFRVWSAGSGQRRGGQFRKTRYWAGRQGFRPRFALGRRRRLPFALRLRCLAVEISADCQPDHRRRAAFLTPRRGVKSVARSHIGLKINRAGWTIGGASRHRTDPGG